MSNDHRKPKRSSRFLKISCATLAFSLTAITRGAYAQDTNSDRVTLVGTAEVIIADSADGKRSNISYALRDRLGRKTELRFVTKPEGLSSGTKIRVSGKRVGLRKVRIADPKKDLQELTAAATAGLSGPKTAIVLKIQSTTSTTSASEAQLAEEVRQAGLRAQELSYGLVSINNDKDANGIPDVRTVFLNQSTAGLGESSAFTLCSQAKTAAAVSGYDHYICILPPDMNYTWYGQAYIGGTDMVIDGQYGSGYPNGLLHEIGHNWGRHHANTVGTEYGDSSCIMGGNAGTANRHFNGPQKMGLGWLTSTAVGSGTFTLNATELSSGQRLLTIRDTVANEDLYISFRAPIGTYSTGPINPLTTAVHTFAGGSSPTYRLAVLADGQSFSRNGITITQASNNGQAAQLTIATTCVTSAPQVTVSPLSFATRSAAPAGFSVVITNRDVNCTDPSTFSLSTTSSDPNLLGSLSSSTAVVAPGQSATVSLTATSSGALPPGSHTVSLLASAAGHPDASTSAKYIYDTQAPSTPSLSGSVNTKRKQVSLSWPAATDAGGSGVSFYRIYRNGTAIGQTSGTSFSDTPGTGTFGYQVQAVDSANNSGSLSNTVSLSIGSTKGRATIN